MLETKLSLKETAFFLKRFQSTLCSLSIIAASFLHLKEMIVLSTKSL